MEFQQLEMFAAVVEEGSVSRAAERVCRTAPAVSIALRKLEEELGTFLFDRSQQRKLQPTTAGKLLYTHATRILEMRKGVTTAIEDLICGRHGTLRLGTHESVGLYFLPSLLRKLNEAHAGFKTEIVCGPSERLLAALRAGTTDLALIADAPNDPDLERNLIMQDQLVLIIHPEHRLRSAKLVQSRDLANEFLLVQGTKSILRERLVHALEASDTPFRLGAQNVAIEAIKRMVAEGMGIGFVPLMCVREEAARGDLITIEVEDVPSQWELWLVHWREYPLSPVARTFVDVTVNCTQSLETSAGTRSKQQEKGPPARVSKRKPFMIEPRKPIHC